jgi:co-chaperonin GroES (HSP10)
MPARSMLHLVDARTEHFARLGNIDKLEVCHNQVVCLIYRRPEQTQSGIILPDQNRDEDKYQGKVGLIVKMGPSAFQPNEQGWVWPGDIGIGDWVYYRASDGWSLSVNQQECRQLDDTDIRGRIDEPDRVW